MIPGMSPRELKRLLKKMGMDINEISDVVKVEIFLKNKKITIEKPEIIVIKTRDQMVFQITNGLIREESFETITINEEDVEFVASQTGVSKEKAREALVKTNGDIAEAILLIRKNEI
ncbi:MAG: nascent polypeptide-associated complex protein [Desulfurococcaceae archaeon]